MKIFYYPPPYSYGAKVIVNNFKDACARAGLDYSLLKDLNDYDPREGIIVPQGVKNGIEILNRGYCSTFILLGDAMSLGYLNKVKFYFRIGHIFNKDFFYSIYGYLRYKREDHRIVRNFRDVVLYSQTDVIYLKKSFPKATCRFHCVPNGIYNIDNFIQKSPTDQLVLGLMSSWGSFQSYEENNWFIRKYFNRYVKSHPHVKLVVAGRGGYTKKLHGLTNVEVVGEVGELGDFFTKIDFFLSVNPKGCGILNRVLDSIVYRVPVIGNSASFSGFHDSESIFLRFNSYDSFCDVLDYAASHRTEMKVMAEKAYAYALKNNDWKCNYDYLVDRILDYLNNKKSE